MTDDEREAIINLANTVNKTAQTQAEFNKVAAKQIDELHQRIIEIEKEQIK